MMMNRSASNYDDADRVHEEEGLGKALEYHLKDTASALAIALELAGLHATRREFVRTWSGFDSKHLQTPDERHDDSGDDLWSEPLSYCRKVLATVESAYEADESASRRAQLELLEFVLDACPLIVAGATPVPHSEEPIKKAMHAHLRNTFSGFVRDPRIAKPIVSFDPDCGIVDLGVAIEFKFVGTEKDFKTAIHGLTEDLSGYAGSRDWTRFYTVIYQTAAFGTRRQVEHALRSSGHADRWHVLLVTGAGSRAKEAKQEMRVRRRPV